jgi:DNA topoisomerase-1
MAMNLLIVESPSKAKTIDKYLDNKFTVISSYGHIRGLPSTTGAVLPDEDFSMHYELLEKSAKAVTEIVKNAKQATAIYLATDPDREGEAISWHIVEMLKEKKALPAKTSVQRIVFNEITKKAVKEAIANPRELNQHLVEAQQARQALDYLVGFTLSPVLWRKMPGSRSAGRVQSVALRIICERESEIEKFNIEEYWSIQGLFNGDLKQNFTASLTHYQGNKLEKLSITNKKQAEAIVGNLKQSQFTVNEVIKKQQKRHPAPPFTTSTMLQDAAKKLGFSAKKTSQLAQRLYEGAQVNGESVGLITYMRTDSVNVSEVALTSVRSYIGKSYGDDFLPTAPRQYKTKTKNAQEAHEAIRPTDVNLTPIKLKASLEEDQYRLYELIWRRFVASQMESALLDVVSANISDSQGNIFRASGSTIVFQGFYQVYREGREEHDGSEEDEKLLPALKENEKLTTKDIIPNQHFTQPPPRYSEASLVKKMEELGIGRPSTYPTIISILQERNYVKLEQKRFTPEARGRFVTAFLTEFFTRYVEYNFTAQLEDKLDDIAQGEIPFKEVLRSFWQDFKPRVDEVLSFKNQDIVHKVEQNLHDFIFAKHNKTEANGIDPRQCPNCKSGKLELKLGKFGAFIGCSNYPECNHVQQIAGLQDKSQETPEDAVATEFPKIVGSHSQTGEEITLRKGPYGIYLQMNDGKKVKRAAIPKNVPLANVDLGYAENLLSLPKPIGTHPETGKPIKVGIGRFGPYVEHDGKFSSIKGIDIFEVDLSKALEILAQPKAPRGKVAKPKKGKK